MEKIVIAIDTMGTDNGSAYFVQGIAEAMDLYDDLSFIVTGKEEELKTYIDQYGCDKTRIEVVDATEEITCHDAPVDAIRRKKNSSMVLALNAVKEGRAAACISGGNSGSTHSTSVRHVVTDRLWRKCGCKARESGTVCKDGFYLYEEYRGYREPSCWYHQYRCGG